MTQPFDHPTAQSARPSPLWFFIKLGVLCALCIAAVVLGHVVFQRDGGRATHVSKTAPASPKIDATLNKTGRSLPKTREQVRRELAEMLNNQLQKSIKKSSKPPLGAALMDAETYGLIHGVFKRRMDGPYGKLYKQLGLDGIRLQKLRGLLAEKELAMLEGYELACEAKIPLGSDTLNALRNETDGAIRELLGEAAFLYYKNYERTLGTRNHVDVLEKRLSYKTEPLSGGQYDALVSALSKMPDPNIKPGSDAWLGTYAPATTSTSLEIAKSILSPSQFAIYESDYERKKAGTAIEKEYSKKFAAAEKERRAVIKEKINRTENTP